MSQFAGPRALADVHNGTIIAVVEIAAPPDRVFRALSSAEITQWWGDDQTYRTDSWECDLRVGGRWRAGGKSADGNPYYVEGEYLEVDPPHRLVQTWCAGWDPGEPTVLSYYLEDTKVGTRLTIRHDGFKPRRESCEAHTSGWERVLGWLKAHFEANVSQSGARVQSE